MSSTLATDPEVRFQRVAGLLGGGVSQVSTAGVRQVIANRDPSDPATINDIAEHVALHSSLSKDAATTVVSSAVQGAANADEAAANVAKAVPQISGQVSLSDPVPLAPWIRLVFGLVLAILAAAAGVGVFHVSREQAPSTAGLVALAILAGLSLLFLVVIVMGYKSVSIQGGTGQSGSGGSGGASGTGK